MQKQKEGFSGERVIVLPQVLIEKAKNDPLLSSLYITDIGYYPTAYNHYRERKTPISEYVLLYCVSGGGIVKFGEKEYTLNQNQYIVLPLGVGHTYWSDNNNPWTIYWIHFNGSHAPYYAEGAQIPRDVKPGLTSRISDRNTIFEEIFTTLMMGNEMENLRYASSLLHYYLGSMRFLQQFRAVGKTLHPDREKDYISIVIRYMEENIETRLSLDEVADYLGYSVSHLSAMFKKAMGVSPINYFNQMKIKEACNLLRESNMKISQISHKVGISDNYYFSRLFTKVMGISPKEYRKNANLIQVN
jgi:AraC-like DNA-binding protein